MLKPEKQFKVKCPKCLVQRAFHLISLHSWNFFGQKLQKLYEIYVSVVLNSVQNLDNCTKQISKVDATTVTHWCAFVSINSNDRHSAVDQDIKYISEITINVNK